MFSTGILLAIMRLYEPFFLFMVKKYFKMCFGILLDEEEEGIKTEALSTFLQSSLNVELVHIILKGIKKFSNIKIETQELNEAGVSEEEANRVKEQQNKENYELMRICRLNRIKIKNPEKWDKAKYDDFVGNPYLHSDNPIVNMQRKTRKGTSGKDSSQKQSSSVPPELDEDHQTMLTINEEVTVFEYAPKVFQEIREMD